MDTLVRRRAEADFPLCRTRGFQKDELLGRIALHKMTSFLLMMTADSSARRREKLQRYKPRNMVVRCEEVKGATAKPPCRLRRGETPAFGKERLWSQDQQFGRAHLARHSIVGRKNSLGGASEEARSYWQGRFAACAFVGGFLEIERPRNCWGAAPNPTRDRRKGTKSPLDPARDIVP